MTPRTHDSDAELGAKIRARRLELGLTIEQAAAAAKLGSETWRRYEGGGAIRNDKVRSVCKALRWLSLPESIGTPVASGQEEPRSGMWDSAVECRAYRKPAREEGDDSELSDEYYQEIEARERAFAIGVDIVSDHLKEAARELEEFPRGTHLGELKGNMLDGDLPAKWLTRYDYEFFHRMIATVGTLVMRHTHPAFDGESAFTRCVADDIAVHLIIQQGAMSLALADNMEGDPDRASMIEDSVDEWEYELMGEDDEVILTLYGDFIWPEATNQNHFERWFEPVYYGLGGDIDEDGRGPEDRPPKTVIPMPDVLKDL